MTYTCFDIPVDPNKPLNLSFLCLQDIQAQIHWEPILNNFHFLLKHIAFIKLKLNARD